MQQADIHAYLKQFFIATQCELTADHPSYLEVQLTADMDKRLMNRPFYWHYLEKTNGTPNPMKVTFITDLSYEEEGRKGDYMHYGARRLHQIFASAKELGSYIRLYEQVPPTLSEKNHPLYPWLGLNIKVSLECDRKKDILYSIGLSLVNGSMVEDFQDSLESLSLVPKIPDMCFTMAPIISVQNGIKRIEDTIMHTQSLEDHQWAQEAVERWHYEQELLEHFYEDMDEFPESYTIEKEALKVQYEPTIKINMINGGIFYLSSQTHQSLLN